MYVTLHTQKVLQVIMSINSLERSVKSAQNTILITSLIFLASRKGKVENYILFKIHTGLKTKYSQNVVCTLVLIIT